MRRDGSLWFKLGRMDGMDGIDGMGGMGRDST